MGAARNYTNAFAHLVGYLEEYHQPDCSEETRNELERLISSEPAWIPSYEEYRLAHPHEPMPELLQPELDAIDELVRLIDWCRTVVFLNSEVNGSKRLRKGSIFLLETLQRLVGYLDEL